MLRHKYLKFFLHYLGSHAHGGEPHTTTDDGESKICAPEGGETSDQKELTLKTLDRRLRSSMNNPNLFEPKSNF